MSDLKKYEATLEYDHESEEYVIEWGESTYGTGGIYRDADRMTIYKRIRNLSCEGWTVTINPHSMPNVSVNEYAPGDGTLSHCPRHRYDCTRCKFAWNCGLPCGCGLSRSEFDVPPEEVKLNRLRAFLEEGDRFIRDRETLEQYIESIWEDR